MCRYVCLIEQQRPVYPDVTAKLRLNSTQTGQADQQT